MAGWFFVTLLTCILFYIYAALLSRKENDYPVLASAGLAIVLTDAIVLRLMVQLKRFTFNPIHLGYGRAAAFSLIANTTSFCLSLLVLYLIDWIVKIT
jgi:hypothetical protein